MSQLQQRKAAIRAQWEAKYELIKMHEKNVISHHKKEELRSKPHHTEEDFKAGHEKLLNHQKACEFLGRRCRSLVGPVNFNSGELSEGQKKRLGDNDWPTPKHLFRVASDVSASSSPYYQSTNGLDSKDVHVPAVLCEKYESKHSIADDLPSETDVISQIGHRLMWYDRNRDPLLSWTNSMLFVLVLGTARVARGETRINIYSIDTETTDKGRPTEEKYKAQNKNGDTVPIDFSKDEVQRAGPAKFYLAEPLLRLTNLRFWRGWKPREMSKLLSNWFTAEWLSHGIVLSDRGSFEAPLNRRFERLLYELYPSAMATDDGEQRRVYDRCVRWRSLEFSKHEDAEPLTEHYLRECNSLASNFMSKEEVAEEEFPDSLKPPLHIFLAVLGMSKRPRQDPVFMQWIRDRYTAKDIAACGYEQTTCIANNNPEIMETIRLARDACIALEIEEIPQIPVWVADADFNSHGEWLPEEPKEVSPSTSSRSSDKDGMVVSIQERKMDWDVYVEWRG